MVGLDSAAAVRDLPPPCPATNPPPVTLLVASPDGQWLAVGDSRGQLNIFNLETMRWGGRGKAQLQVSGCWTEWPVVTIWVGQAPLVCTLSG